MRETHLAAGREERHFYWSQAGHRSVESESAVDLRLQEKRASAKADTNNEACISNEQDNETGDVTPDDVSLH